MISLGLIASATYSKNADNHKNVVSSVTTTLIISKEEMKDMKIGLKESGLLIKDAGETIENKLARKGKFLGRLLGLIGSTLLGNL